MPQLKPLKGRLLIAEPSILNDNSFNRTAILITEHTEKNSVGFILNRPLNLTIKDLMPDLNCDFVIYQGGPVEQDNLYFVHRIPDLIPDSLEVDNGIYWGGNFEAVMELISKNLIKCAFTKMAQPINSHYHKFSTWFKVMEGIIQK